MRKLMLMRINILHAEYIGMQRRPGEVKHLSNQRKRKKQNPLIFIHRSHNASFVICVLKINGLIPLVVASERGTAQT